MHSFICEILNSFVGPQFAPRLHKSCRVLASRGLSKRRHTMRDRRRHSHYAIPCTILCVVGQASGFLSTATATAATSSVRHSGVRRRLGVELSCASAAEAFSATARCARKRVCVCFATVCEWISFNSELCTKMMSNMCNLVHVCVEYM